VARLPVVGSREVDRVLRQLGFLATRQRGSHVFYRHADGRTTTVPHHAGRDITPSLLRSILGQAQVTPGEFLARLRS
jgi:predicted RNA binding protein YcfA (HicA-like mRNA interferase family)